MSERDGFAPGVPCWVDTWQPDADAAVGFYTELFGWEAEDTMPDGVEGTHYMCSLRGRDVAAIASRPNAAPDVMRGRSAGEAEERPVSRSEYPTPRTVWIKRGSPPSSVLRRR